MGLILGLLLIVMSGMVGAYLDKVEGLESKAFYWLLGGLTGTGAIILVHLL